MRTGRISILLFTFVYLLFINDVSATTTKIPDFAYPKTVSQQAAKSLATAIEKNDGPEITRALINLYLADTRIDGDKAPQAIAKIDSICAASADPVLKAMLLTLGANIYTDLYANNRWKYDARTLPPTPLPADYKEWSGQQFRDRIISLIDSALGYKAELENKPIDTYKSVIDLGESRSKGSSSLSAVRETTIYYPTLFDFVASKSISMLNSLGHIQSIFSWGLLTRHDIYLLQPFSKFDPVAAKILEIYSSLLSFHKPGSAPFVNTDISRLEFVSSHVYSGDGNPESRKLSLLRDLYNENIASEYSGDVLIAIGPFYEDQKWLFDALNHNIETFKGYDRINNLRNMLLRVKRQSISAEYPRVAAPGVPMKFKLKAGNVSAGKLYIYNVSSSDNTDASYSCTGLPSFKPAAVIPFTTKKATVPFEETVVLEHSFPTVGQYIAIPVIDGVVPTERRWYNKINVTKYSLASSNFDKTTLWAIDAMDGAPVEGAKIMLSNRSRSSKQTAKLLGTTSADGSLIGKGSGRAWMDKNGDKYAPSIWIYENGIDRPDEKWYPSANGFSSLPLYHPCDTVEWMAVCYEFKDKSHRPRMAKEITAVLRNASYQGIDTVKLTTDPFGRVAGKFVIPKDCLSGRFVISVDDYSDAVSFEVSDYKLPTFRVILDNVEKDVPTSGAVTMRGRVETYAGFPVADAQITVGLSAMQQRRWWWSRSNPVKFQTLKAVSDASGAIEITIGKDILDLTPIPDGIFSAEVSAMSPSGETQTASIVFSLGNRYVIRVSAPENIDISKPISTIKAQVVDYRDSVVNIPVDYALLRDSSEILRGTLLPSQTTIDFGKIQSGAYKLRFSLADSTLAKEVTSDIVLYRPTDKDTPLPGKLLWYPTEKLNVAPGKAAAWLYAVDCPTNILVTVHTDDKIISQKWMKSDAGMHTLPIDFPDNLDSATAEIMLTGNYRSASARIELRRDIPEKGIKFVTETFRDRLIPGSEETWTFRVIDESGSGRKAAVVLDMYNTALDALAKQRWQLNFYSQNTGYYFSWQQPRLSEKNNVSISRLPGKTLPETGIFNPIFNTYGLGFYPYDGLETIIPTAQLRIRGLAATSKSAVLNDVREHKEEVMADAVEEMAADEEAAVFNSAADAGNAAGMVDNVKAKKGEGAASEETAQETPFTFRDREVPLAFFKPMLTTDADGNLSLTFTVPNANTTWGLRAVAYTDSLLSTSFAADVVANKPVMVQPNLPRFLRAGDTVEIIASVMNGSDTEQTVDTRIELFNPTDGKTIYEYTQTDTLAANSSTEASIKLVAPADAPFIGYRVKSSTDRYADGEQTLIPVLPAVTPVIDSYPFYVAPDSAEFTMQLPESPTDARITLQFCENPTWYVVTALPGLLDIEASTANEAAASIFSASIASGLLHDNPAIAEALKMWTESDKGDDTLKSMLDKNEDLKQVLLASTPWMLDAKNDSERMTRLALLFDSKTVNRAIKANTSMLRKLVRDGGGWAWMSQCSDPSRWATENVLMLLGRLHRLSYLPQSKELRSMIIAALKWIDKETTRDYRKYPKSDYTTYAYLRGLYKDMKDAPKANTTIISATTQRILSRWKSGNAFEKAIDAQILAANSYPSVAKKILASLREYSQYSPTKGMWWPSLDNMTVWSMGKIGATATILDAFAQIEPGCADIDRIRQWLILQKEAKDWGTSVTTSAAIASILSSSSKWVSAANAARVEINGNEIKPTKTEKLTGYFRVPLTLPGDKKSQLLVSRKGDNPSWGSVMYLYKDSITSVKAASCPELSIEKSIVVSTESDGKPESVYADSLSLGQKVSVTLTLHVDRDMDYVTIVDERPACYEPVDQLPTPLFSEGIYFYRENRDASTRLFIDHLPKGVYILSYDVWVNNAGTFASGIATAQSQYAPQFTAHSAGTEIKVATK